MKQINCTDRVKVSSLVLGTDVFGTRMPEEMAHRLMDEYVDRGGNTFDTARIYGRVGPDLHSASEETIGKWMRSRGRHHVAVSTKCAHPEPATMHISRLSRAEIEGDVDGSLMTLGTDYIDILWLHRDDVSLPVEDIVDTLNGLVNKGKILSFGGSNWTAARLAEANRYAAASGQMGFFGSQLKYSCGVTSPDFAGDPTLLEMDPTEYKGLAEMGLVAFAYTSQARGFFYKMESGGAEALPEWTQRQFLCEENLRRYEALRELCARHGLSMQQAVLGALTANTDFPACAIIGCSSPDQLRAAMDAAEADLTALYPELRAILRLHPSN